MQASDLINHTRASERLSRLLILSSTGRSVCCLVMGMVLYSCVASMRAEPLTSRPQDDTAAIVSLVGKFNKTRDKQEQEECRHQLDGYKQNWEAMLLAACDRRLGLGKNDILMPILAAPGKSVVPKIVELLIWNPDVNLDTAVKVTQRIGDEGLPSLMENYRTSASVLVRRYVAISVKEIVARRDSKKADSAEMLQWVLKVADDRDDVVVAASLRTLRAIFIEENAEKVEPVVKAKLKDARPMVRMTAIDVLTQVRPKADYVKEHVVTGALKSRDRVERDMNIRLCTRLPESDDVLNVLYECAFDMDEQIREVAAQALGTLGPKALPLAHKMLKKLQEGNAESLPAILSVLKHSKEDWDAIEEALVKCLGSESVRTLGVCLGFLASRSLKDDTIRTMTTLLDNSDKQVRMLAVRALHEFAHKEFVQEAIAKRRDREADKGVKQLLDVFMSEVGQADKARKPTG